MKAMETLKLVRCYDDKTYMYVYIKRRQQRKKYC